MMPQLLVYPPFHQLIFDLNNFTSVPHLNRRELIRKSPKKFRLARN
jgi:hypothetical protein